MGYVKRSIFEADPAPYLDYARHLRVTIGTPEASEFVVMSYDLYMQMRRNTRAQVAFRIEDLPEEDKNAILSAQLPPRDGAPFEGSNFPPVPPGMVFPPPDGGAPWDNFEEPEKP